MKIIFLSSYDGGRFIIKSPAPNHDGFFTSGWNANLARVIKKYYSEYDVEVWHISKNSVGYYEKTIDEIKYKVYPAFRIKYIIDISIKGLSNLLTLSKKEPIIIYLPIVHRPLVYLIALFIKKPPIIVQDLGEIPPKVKVLSNNIFKKFLYRSFLLIEKFSFKNIDFFCIGDQNHIQYIKEVFPEFNGDYVPAKGININIFSPDNKIIAKNKLGWDLNKKYILYVGRLEKIKNVDELIKIWKEIKKEMPEAELVFIGGRETDPLYNLAKENNVIMYPRQLNADLPIYYSAADVYCLINLENAKFSGLGIAPGESLACGTPVVSEGLRNIPGGNLEGIGEAPKTLDDFKEAIIKVLKNPDNYTKCREVIIEHYSEEAVANRFEQIIEQVSSKYSQLK